jgi:type IX secretion system PorP/SprF family membrane protein
VNAQYNALQSQYMLNPIVVNPGYAGAEKALSLTAGYRKQWMQLTGAPETFSFTAHTPYKNPRINFGVTIGQDNIAFIKSTTVQGIYAYRIISKKFSLALGISPGIAVHKCNWGDLVTVTSNDNAFQGVYTKTTDFVTGYGLYFNTKRFFFGANSRLSYSFSETSIIKDQTVQLFSGYTIYDSPDFKLNASTLVRFVPKKLTQADINVMGYYHEKIGLGISYRHKDAVLGIVDVRLNEQFNLGYSYDFTLSKLNNHSTGTHELVLRYNFKYTINPQSSRFF